MNYKLSNHKYSGFTLVELLVTLVVAAILTMLAVTSFKPSIDSASQKSNLDNFIAQLKFARTEAVKRGKTVSLYTSGTDTWHNQFYIYIDNDSSSIYNNGDDLIRKIPQDEFRDVTINSTTSNFSFNPNGTTTALTFTFTQGGSSSTVTLNQYGKITIN